MAVPTYRGGAATAAWNTTGASKTIDVSVVTGDWLLLIAVEEPGSLGWGLPSSSVVTTTTWEEIASLTNGADQKVWKAQATGTGTLTITIDNSNGGDWWGARVQVWEGASGFGTPVTVDNVTGIPSTSISISTDGAIAMLLNDSAGAAPAYTYNESSAGTFTEVDTTDVSGAFGLYLGYYASPGAAGSKTIGLTTPSLTHNMTAVEVLTAGSTVTPSVGSVTLAGRVLDLILAMRNDARIVIRKA